MNNSRHDNYGVDLAKRVYDYLKENNSIDSNHFGYCGVGFVCEGSKIHYTHFDEWLTWRSGTQYKPGGEYVGIIKTFHSEKDFIEWLSLQTDHSLSGFEANDDWYEGNQRITKARLIRVICKNRRFSR